MARAVKAPKTWQAQFLDLLQKVSRPGKHSITQMFDRFLEATACALSNSSDWRHYDEREKRFNEIVAGDFELRDAFAQMLAIVILALEEQPRNFFGDITMQIPTSFWKGQIWTPYEVGKMMSTLILHDIKDIILRQGHCTIQEPACGPGGMIIAAVEIAKEQGLDPSAHLFVQGIDIDLRCVHMTYIVCCAMGIPAEVVHMNALASEPPWSVWLTPAYIRGGWRQKLASRAETTVPAGEQPALLAAE